MDKDLYQLILASQSPRRKELLSALNISFQVKPANINEDIDIKEPSELVEELALRKAQAISKHELGNYLVMGSDTVVHFEGNVLGKPQSRDEAHSFMEQLSHNTHEVYSGVAIVGEKVEIKFFTLTRVTFNKLTQKDIELYLDQNEYADKAGGYGIQGAASVFVNSIEGSYSSVVGLPQAQIIQKFYELFGLEWRSYFA